MMFLRWISRLRHATLRKILLRRITLVLTLREKCPNTELFLVRIFLYSGKYGPEKTQYLTTFHTV